MTTTTLDRTTPTPATTAVPAARPTAPNGEPILTARPFRHLSAEQVAAIGAELDAIRTHHLADRGAADARYIRRMVRLQRGLEVSGRGLLFLSFLPPAWLAGVAALGVAKILDNMEIGHNVMHGQYDWMGDPALSSQQFEWDTACPSAQWRHSHNYLHHTWTNVIGRDRDLGYGVLRMSETQPWRPMWLGNPIYALLLATFFEYGVALHDLEVENLRTGRRQWSEVSDLARAIRHKSGKQARKDYLWFPLLAGPLALPVLLGNAAANLIRNVWAFSIIFCGHFPDGVEEFSEDEIEGESRGGWYLRQMLGSANITGGRTFHVLSGNLSHQIEHHLFPDIPARRYAAISADVQDLCRRYDLPYNTGRFSRQLGSVVRRIVRLALPRRSAPSAG